MKYHETSLQVRFYEVDAYGVVWHGHYVGWFETGRNDLTQQIPDGSPSAEGDESFGTGGGIELPV